MRKSALVAMLTIPVSLALSAAAAIAVTASDPRTSTSNGTALEPYLVTWLLPISGALTAGVMLWVDKRVRGGARI